MDLPDVYFAIVPSGLRLNQIYIHGLSATCGAPVYFPPARKGRMASTYSLRSFGRSKERALRKKVEKHMHGHPHTVFLSAYSEKWVALEEREKLGDQFQVVQLKVILGSKGLDFRNVASLAGKLKVDIRTRPHAEHEWIFRHKIPSNAIEKVRQLK
ncbi:hypothetical protein DM02DRAFT_618601 [Periconia macrospinosa]|uniref:Uncharacterized protein n=1 Tax=Periconia macrospinosa TaxID=97972 RepID=A0A2V1DBC0_9PLEO|nr:hypothetical protein DM02DRAFT_618601 [Periconia macrospinosa]